MNGQVENQTKLKYVRVVKLRIGIQKKKCHRCEETKKLTEFYKNKRSKDGHCSRCKVCDSEYGKIWASNNKERLYKRNKEWVSNNPDKVKKKMKKYCDSEKGKATRKRCQENNKHKRKEYSAKYYNSELGQKTTKAWVKNNPDKVRAKYRRWRKNNPDKVKEQNDRRYATIKGNLRCRISGGINRSLRAKKARVRKSGRHWETLVDFTCEELIIHLENLFVDGMSWENRNMWHIDHILPVASFNYSSPDDVEFKKCWSLDNLQPLWRKDNEKKGSKILNA